MSEDSSSVVAVPLNKSKGESTECNNYRGISLLSVVGKICAKLLMDSVWRVIEGLIDNEQRGYVD